MISKVIQVLEQMGSDATFQNKQSEQAIERLLTATEVNAEQAEAIINKDIISLEHQLDVCPDIVCFVLPADDDENGDDKENEDDSTKETSNTVIGF